MKSFSQFLFEAAASPAAAQAHRLGLVSSKGAWYDKSGKYVAKTVNGELKFASGSGRKPEEDKLPGQGKVQDPAKKKKKPSEVVSAPKTKQPQAQAQEPAKKEPAAAAPKPTQSPETQQQEPSGQSTLDGIVVTFGRFNPPTVGHEKLLKAASAEASRKKYDLKIYPSRSQDKKKNPLEPATKIKYMQMMFPDYAEQIVDDPEAKTIFNVLIAAFELGYRNVVIMVGQDRLSEFQSLAHKYDGDLYQFDSIEVVSAGARDADSEGVEGMSASKMRKAAMENDFMSFSKGIPKLGNMEKKNLFNVLRKSMGAKEVKEVHTWEIAPKLDLNGLRLAYLDEEVFKVGELVENVNTGEVGRITRRGANYVICMTSEGAMFKAWLKDLVEAYEIGTDEYRKYVQAQSAGQPVKKFGPKISILPTIKPSKPNDPIKYK